MVVSFIMTFTTVIIKLTAAATKVNSLHNELIIMLMFYHLTTTHSIMS